MALRLFLRAMSSVILTGISHEVGIKMPFSAFIRGTGRAKTLAGCVTHEAAGFSLLWGVSLHGLAPQSCWSVLRARPGKQNASRKSFFYSLVWEMTRYYFRSLPKKLLQVSRRVWRMRLQLWKGGISLRLKIWGDRKKFMRYGIEGCIYFLFKKKMKSRPFIPSIHLCGLTLISPDYCENCVKCASSLLEQRTQVAVLKLLPTHACSHYLQVDFYYCTHQEQYPYCVYVHRCTGTNTLF